MTGFDFTPEQEAVIRARLGFGPDDREMEPADIVIVLEVQRIMADAEKKWLEGEDP